MGSLSNGELYNEVLNNKQLKEGHCTSALRHKYKLRKVSTVCYFPPGRKPKAVDDEKKMDVFVVDGVKSSLRHDPNCDKKEEIMKESHCTSAITQKYKLRKVSTVCYFPPGRKPKAVDDEKNMDVVLVDGVKSSLRHDSNCDKKEEIMKHVSSPKIEGVEIGRRFLRKKPFSSVKTAVRMERLIYHEENGGDYSVAKSSKKKQLSSRKVSCKNNRLVAHDKGICIEDISNGEELVRICAVNTIDDEKPPAFMYTTKMIYPSWYSCTPPEGCGCIDGCSDSRKCLCIVKNGEEIPYNQEGAILKANTLVHECGPSCKCPPSCHNRVTQNGMKIQLEIFKTETRGWGVRSLTSIRSGSFICEYVGELLDDKEAEQRHYDVYLFDIGRDYTDCSDQSLSQTGLDEVTEDSGFTIDAAVYGNVGRFINHSCSPNLYPQNVIYDHDDKSMPHIMLFAAENIPPLHELTYDYGYLDKVCDSNGNVRMKSCYCGSEECTGRMY